MLTELLRPTFAQFVLIAKWRGIQAAQNVFVEDRSLAVPVVASEAEAYERYNHNSASNTAPEDDLGASETVSAPVIVTCVAMATNNAHNYETENY